MKVFFTLLATAVSLTTLSQPAAAHFPWLAIDDDGKAVCFFGETPAERTYKLPPAISEAKVSLVTDNQQVTDLQLETVENEDFVGVRSKSPVPASSSLFSQVTYGIYHGSKLQYYALHCGGRLTDRQNSPGMIAKRLRLTAELIDSESGVDVFVSWDGKPLADVEVKLFCDEGHEEGSATTDQQGKVSFSDQQVEEGLNGIVVGYTDSDETGTLDGAEYQSGSHYLTVTFNDPQDFEQPESGSKVTVLSDVYPAIPETVTSFGGAVANNSLFIYGGHKGRAHEYYSEAQANTLWKLDLSNPKSWESLGTGPRLQGLAMVAHDDKLYRIGGFTAKNNEQQAEDLWSQAAVSRYDLATGQWREMPPLPEPRSSFDAAVLDGQIYVVGGWTMRGEDETTWLDTAYRLDLSQDRPQWQRLPDPPFQRRALSVAAHHGKLYVIGGMQKTGGPSTRVDVFDVASQQWSRGPDLIGEGMDGFGSSAFAVGDRLYVTTYSGALQRLDAVGDSWTLLRTLDRDRFFHRLLPLADNRLLAIGGASMSSGKFDEIDVIQLPTPAVR